MAKRTVTVGILVLAAGAQIPAFAISKGTETGGCGSLIASVRIPEYHATQKKRQRYVRLRSYADRQHAASGETADLMKRCGAKTLETTAISGAGFIEVIRVL